MKRIEFDFRGRTYRGFQLSRDSDPTAQVWVVDAENPDRDYFVSPDAVRPLGKDAQ